MSEEDITVESLVTMTKEWLYRPDTATEVQDRLLLLEGVLIEHKIVKVADVTTQEQCEAIYALVTGDLSDIVDEPAEEFISVRTTDIYEKVAANILAESRRVDPKVTMTAPYGTEKPTARAQALEGKTYKLKFGADGHAIYITINDVIENGQRRPFEVFINSKNMQHYAWTVAMTRMISAIFRRPHDSRFVVEELKAVFDPSGGAWMDGRYVPSVISAIGMKIEEHMDSIGYMTDETVKVTSAVDGPTMMETAMKHGAFVCTNCNSTNLKLEAGCFTCLDCGHSKCG